MPPKKIHPDLPAKGEDLQEMNPTQGGSLVQDFHIVPLKEAEVEEGEDHLMEEEEIQTIEAMARS